MALDMNQEEKALGMENFARAANDLTRRGFMKSLVISGSAVAVAGTAAYFGYQSIKGNPVKAALIGGGDEGGVLVGEHNPEFLEFVAVCDIRPSNMKRIFEGQGKTHIRKGFKVKYGSDADKIKKYDDYAKMLRDNKDIEAVVIALPLHLHAPVAIEAMRIGQERGKPIHVLCEKLMAWNIDQCKKMIRVAKETNSILSIGHQRHYSMLYAHATEVIKAGVLGDIRHIRALWHRNNTWEDESPSSGQVPGTERYYRDGWFPPVPVEDYEHLKDTVKKYGYDSVEQLVRWRLYNETGGGLMAELGSHQLDACSIFLGKVHPIAVSGYGGKTFYRPGKNDRECDDHVFATYEFPGPNYPADKNDVVVVTYSSINTNGFEPYGECVMGTRGSMVVQAEQEVMLYKEPDPRKKQSGPRSLSVGVTSAGGGPALDASATYGAPSAVTGTAIGAAGSAQPVSRGYREEMEDFAYCVRMWDQAMEGDRRLPRCHGEVAMADAIIALTANKAMGAHLKPEERRQERIVFQDSWFDYKSDEVPDDPNSQPKVKVN